MTPQQLVGIAVRLFAIWLALSSVAYFVSIPRALSTQHLGNDSISAVVYSIGTVYLFGALFLWFFPLMVAHKLIPRTQYENRLSFQAHELARVGCVMLGLWLLATSSPSLVWLLFRAFLLVDSGSSFATLTPDAKLDIAVALFSSIFALVLIGKSGLLAKFLVPATQADEESPS